MSSIVQSVYHARGALNKHSHFHDCHQLIFVVKGSVDFFVNQKSLCARAGELVVFSRYENHSVLGCSEDYERYVLQVDPNVVNRESPVYSLLTDRPAGFSNVIDLSLRSEEVKGVFERLLQEHGSREKLSDEMAQLTAKQLLITLYRSSSLEFDRPYDRLVLEVKRQFENQCGTRFTLTGLAKEYSVSVSSLSHRFQEATGVSVMEYLKSCRIANAKRLLAETGLCIGEIVAQSGFSDSSNFSRAFRQATGLSPTAFRKKHKGA